jgi:hypothetical protein
MKGARPAFHATFGSAGKRSARISEPMTSTRIAPVLCTALLKPPRPALHCRHTQRLQLTFEIYSRAQDRSAFPLRETAPGLSR